MMNKPDKQSLRSSLLFAISVLLPFGMGVRQCEKVVIGHECNPDGGSAKYCGCEYDGQHYDNGEGFKSSDGCNDCSCQADGQVICTLKACVQLETCGGIAGLQCSDDKYCDFAPEAQCGAADQTGTCKSRPEICTEEFAPVCGCDDKTYPNSCYAAREGISVVSKGECASAGVCVYEGQKHQPGESYPASDGCNTCTCEKDGSSSCTEKACPVNPACGSRGLPACADGQYCKFAPAAECGRADRPGTCAPIPQACTKEFKPVCGCDDKTYGNACTAAAAGVSVLYDGECKVAAGGCDYNGQHYEDGASFKDAEGCNTCTCNGETGAVGCTKRACIQICGGLTGAQCADGKYCEFAPDALCGAADQTGICQPIPGACTLEYNPVCGCDDKTYGNACAAAGAGVSVRAQGECPAAGGCDYNGQHYDAGASFPADDGCNDCNCQDDGTVVCTLKACAPQKACGGLRGLRCADSEYCDYPRDALCGAADATGVCKVKPEACTAIYDPVCGCDDKTYSNACYAAVAGVSDRADGECQ